MHHRAQTANSHAISPFWTRVPRFFLFPLYPPALMRVVAFAALTAVGALATSIPAMVVVIGGCSLLAWIFFLRFGSRVLSETSLGRLSPEEYPAWQDETLAPHALQDQLAVHDSGPGGGRDRRGIRQ